MPLINLKDTFADTDLGDYEAGILKAVDKLCIRSILRVKKKV
jgi:hypothetical protein